MFLFQANTAIFRNILNMFICNDNKDNYHSHNKKDNYLLIKIISGYIILVNDFNLDNLHKFQFILNHSSKQNTPMNSVSDIKEDINGTSFDSENYKSKNKKNKNFKKNQYKKEIINTMLGRNNNSEFVKLNVSSSKQSLNSNVTSNDILNNLNNPQLILENNNSNNTKKSIINSNSNTNNNLINNRDSYKDKSAKIISKKKLKNINQIEKPKKIIIEENLNEEENMTSEMFLKKLVNNGINEIKISIYILNILFILAIIYGFIKIVFSVKCLMEIIEIFEDFSVISYRYSSIYYYFNSLRTLLVFPDFGNETIFDTINENMNERLKKMNYVLDFKLDKYPSVGNYYWIAGTNMKKPRPSPSYINITCYEDQLCRKIINHTKYEVFSEGIKMAVTTMYQQIINIYEDYKKNKENIKESKFIKEKFINSQYEQIDINLNYVIISVEYRVYEAFINDLTSLIEKYNSLIEMLNICMIIYIFIAEFIVIVFIVFKLKKKIKTIENVTFKINKSINHMLKRNLYFENKEEDSFLMINNSK